MSEPCAPSRANRFFGSPPRDILGTHEPQEPPHEENNTGERAREHSPNRETPNVELPNTPPRALSAGEDHHENEEELSTPIQSAILAVFSEACTPPPGIVADHGMAAGGELHTPQRSAVLGITYFAGSEARDNKRSLDDVLESIEDHFGIPQFSALEAIHSKRARMWDTEEEYAESMRDTLKAVLEGEGVFGKELGESCVVFHEALQQELGQMIFDDDRYDVGTNVCMDDFGERGDGWMNKKMWLENVGPETLGETSPDTENEDESDSAQGNDEGASEEGSDESASEEGSDETDSEEEELDEEDDEDGRFDAWIEEVAEADGGTELDKEATRVVMRWAMGKRRAPSSRDSCTSEVPEKRRRTKSSRT